MSEEQEAIYRVVVGNIGTVYRFTKRIPAEIIFEEYVALSRNGHGRCAFEPVALFEGDEILREWLPPRPNVRLNFELAFSLISCDEEQAIVQPVIDEIAARLRENLKEFLSTADWLEGLTDDSLLLKSLPESVRLAKAAWKLE